MMQRARNWFVQLTKRSPEPKVEIIGRGEHEVTCRIDGHIFLLNPSNYIDNELLEKGVFEPDSVKWLPRLISLGDVTADVGANFGYYSLQMSRLVGPSGRVFAFEPASEFRSQLVRNLDVNQVDNVTIVPFGLSDAHTEGTLLSDEISGTLHWPDDLKAPTAHEKVELVAMDSYFADNDVNRLDFVKIDVDGHEPQMLHGAERTLRSHQPFILIEFSQLNLMAGGSDVPALAKQLRDLGYVLYSEKTGLPFQGESNFLRETMNCSHSVNVIAVHETSPAHSRGGPPLSRLGSKS